MKISRKKVCLSLAVFSAVFLFGFSEAKAAEDSNPPQLTSLSISPTEINTSEQSQVLTLRIGITDDWAGVSTLAGGGIGQCEVVIIPLIGTQFKAFTELNRVYGDDKNGIYESTVTLPMGSKVGVWQIYLVTLTDKIGNHIYIYPSALSTMPNVSNITIANTADSSSVRIEKEWTLSSSNVSADFSADTVVTKKEGGSFSFYQMVNQDFSIGDVTSNGLDSTDISNIAGKIKIGIPGLNLSFSKPVTLEFNVGSQYNGQVLEIQTLEESGSSWANETTCTVSGGKCSFTVDHASYFAAIKTTASSTSSGTVTGNTNSNIVISTDTPTLNYSASKKAKKKINLTFNNLRLTKKKWVKVRLNGRKVTVARVRRSGSNSIVAISFKYKKWAIGNYNLAMTYKNQTKVPYTTKKGKTKYRKGWESGGVNSENILSII